MEASVSTKWGWTNYCLLAAGISWVIGIIFVEFFMHYTRRLRNLSASDKQRFLPFTNEPEKWNRLVFYVCSVLIVPRVVTFALVSVILALSIRVIMIGSDPEKPLIGWKKWLVKFLGNTVTRAGLFIQSFMWIKYKNDEIDYSKWLGPNWKTAVPEGRPPIIVSNHMSWSDILLAMTTSEFPAFISGAMVKSYPLYGSIAQAIGSLFVERADEKSRNATLVAIKERTDKILSDPRYPPLWVCPEGCTSNGKMLLRFKKGAFYPEAHIQPIYIEYSSPFCNVSFDAIPTMLHFFFIACQPASMITVHRMPVICPTEFMYSHYKGQAESNAEIYAEVLRDIMCTTYGLGRASQSLVDKQTLLKYLYDFRTTKLE